MTSPAYCSDVAGDTAVTLVAPGLQEPDCEMLEARRWLGHSDTTVATIDLDAKGSGSFIFPANAYPHGPVTVRISV